MGVFVSFVRLMDFLMHDRFYAFVRYLSMTGAWVLQRIVRQVRTRCLGVLWALLRGHTYSTFFSEADSLARSYTCQMCARYCMV